MIKWKGQNTQKNITWKEEADSYRELYFKLIDRDIISVVDYFPDEEYMLNKVGLSTNSFDNDDLAELYDYDFMNWYNEVTKGIDDLTEDEYKMIIRDQRGDAYYQEFEEINEYIIRDRETGNIIEETASKEKAEEIVRSYEEEDKKDGNYTPDFYEIIKGGN